jgi:ubiquinone/menaquinone biosynthesis C-methylase UbiE
LFRLQLRARCWYADRFDTPPIAGPPLPPAMLRYRVSELLGRQAFLTVGENCAVLIEQHLRQMGSDLARARRVLDFGCGCGRTMRWFLHKYPAVEFHGADVDAEAIQWCREHLRNASFVRNEPAPPLPYPDASFDAIYCLSVFTHLDEPMQDAWLAELSRLLAPSGVLLLTVHSELAAQSLDSGGLAELQSRGFLHRRSQKLRGILPHWYHTTWHSQDYIVKRLRTWFADVRYETVAGGTQSIVLAQRSPNEASAETK